MNMILAETIIACFGIPVDALASWQHGWKSGKELCEATGFILTTTGELKFFSLIKLPFELGTRIRAEKASLILSTRAYYFLAFMPNKML